MFPASFVSFSLFKMGMLSLGNGLLMAEGEAPKINNYFAEMPEEVLCIISKWCSPSFTAAPPFERAIPLVQKDGLSLSPPREITQSL